MTISQRMKNYWHWQEWTDLVVVDERNRQSKQTRPWDRWTHQRRNRRTRHTVDRNYIVDLNVVNHLIILIIAQSTRWNIAPNQKNVFSADDVSVVVVVVVVVPALFWWLMGLKKKQPRIHFPVWFWFQRTHTGDRPFACPLVSCAKSFAQYGGLMRHFKSHDKVRDLIVSQQIKCIQCEGQFETIAALLLHSWESKHQVPDEVSLNSDNK